MSGKSNLAHAQPPVWLGEAPIPVHTYFGARIEGLDLRKPFTPDQIEAFRSTMDHYGILVRLEFDEAGTGADAARPRTLAGAQSAS